MKRSGSILTTTKPTRGHDRRANEFIIIIIIIIIICRIVSKNMLVLPVVQKSGTYILANNVSKFFHHWTQE